MCVCLIWEYVLIAWFPCYLSGRINSLSCAKSTILLPTAGLTQWRRPAGQLDSQLSGQAIVVLCHADRINCMLQTSNHLPTKTASFHGTCWLFSTGTTTHKRVRLRAHKHTHTCMRARAQDKLKCLDFPLCQPSQSGCHSEQTERCLWEQRVYCYIRDVTICLTPRCQTLDRLHLQVMSVLPEFCRVVLNDGPRLDGSPRNV